MNSSENTSAPAREIYAKRRNPYYILAPGYDRLSSGIRVMHHLCDCLNRMGEEAYLVSPVVSPNLHTPQLNEIIRVTHELSGLNPIAVYPEIVGANPLDCDIVVRYILNRVGLLGEKPNYAEDDIFWLHNHEVADSVSSYEGVLYLPAVDTTVFHNNDNPDDSTRGAPCIYFGRYQEGRTEYAELAASCVEITKSFPATHEDLALLFRQSSHVYCFENTSISLEARLCGCPVVQLKSKFTAGGELFSAGIGLAVGLISDDRPETLMQTRAQLPSLTHRYKEVEQEFWRSLASFIEQTQEASQVRPRRARRAAPDPFQIAYQEWQQRSAFGELDAQLYAERLMTCWSHRPGFHLLMSVQQNELDVLQKTIDSLTQQLYGEWLLTVVSSMPKPTILAQNESRLQWLTVKDDAHTQYVLSEMAAVSPGHWLALVAPGVICEPQCLLVVGDQVNEHPDWQLIYVDEDTMEEDGSLTQPLFKPDFNLDLLRSQSYVGSMVWVKKEALISAGGYGHCTGAENFDVCLRIADRHGGEGIGHIPQILAHLHRGSQRNWSELAEQTALETHCNRRQLDAKVLQGQLRCTWRVEPVWLSQPLVSLIVQSGVWGERLGPWLTALKQNTRYPALELVLIDQDPDNQDTASLSHAIATSDTWIGRVVRVRGSGTSETSLANQGTEAARGEYILFLNECVAAPKSEWLGTLMSRAQRTEAGIVVPSLTTTKGTQENIGPEIMGTSEIRPPASSTSSAHKAGGYMGRHFCDQNVNTVATAAVLVRKSVITSLGGLDMRYSTQKHALKDLCLRVVRAKLLIIWTPHAQLQLNADCLRTPLSSEAQEAFANSLKLEREDQQIFRTQWLNALAHDPAYNPNLSLVTPWLPDLSSVGRWPVHPMARPRLLGISFAPDGESFHALSSALTSVHGVGAAQTLMLSPITTDANSCPTLIDVARLNPNTMAMRNPFTQSASDLMKACHLYRPDIQRVVFLDDISHVLPIHTPPDELDFIHTRPLLRPLLSLADRVVVPSKPWADLCEGMAKEIHVIPNVLDAKTWTSFTSPRKARQRLRVGLALPEWHGQEQQFMFELMSMLPDELDWVALGSCPTLLQTFCKEVIPIPVGPQALRAYLLAQADLDVALMPLTNTPINGLSSDRMAVELGAIGNPVLCSDVPAFEGVPGCRLAMDTELWADTLMNWIANPDRARQDGANLQAWVLSHRLSECVLHPVFKALSQEPSVNFQISTENTGMSGFAAL